MSERKYARRLYQQLCAGDDGDRRVFLPAMIPLHAQMKELGCEGASQQQPAAKRPRRGRRYVRSTAVTHVILPLQGAACFARPPALLNYGAIPPPGAAALLCPLTAGGASRLVPERDPGIHAPAGGATAGGPAH